MLFNSYIFILLFFPAVLIGYFTLNNFRLQRTAIFFLFSASLFFYGYWNPIYLPLLLLSIITNYSFGVILSAKKLTHRKLLLTTGILFNIVLLGYFKYSDFFINNLNYVLNEKLTLLKIILPLGISFFTFTQIAFLVDAYQEKIKEPNLLNYCLFVTFFPHLLAGPIIHHAEMMPQFADSGNKKINYKNLVIGLMVFAIGLFKKTCIADPLAEWVNNGYLRIPSLTVLEAWFLSFSYTLQLYFDFSGYTDMAIGCSLMLNIKLPENFNSPYKAQNIQEFWQRWHMTLSRWLKQYVYIPLGGNRKNAITTHINLVLTFLIGGFWHGAGWTYIVWGLLHGLAISIHRLWKKINIRLPKLIAWFITIVFINLTWIFFRANSITQAFTLLRKMFSIPVLNTPHPIKSLLFGNDMPDITANHGMFLFLIFLFTLICFTAKNSIELKSSYTGSMKWNTFIAATLALGILGLTRVTTFIYFQF